MKKWDWANSKEKFSTMVKGKNWRAWSLKGGTVGAMAVLLFSYQNCTPEQKEQLEEAKKKYEDYKAQGQNPDELAGDFALYNNVPLMKIDIISEVLGQNDMTSSDYVLGDKTGLGGVGNIGGGLSIYQEIVWVGDYHKKAIFGWSIANAQTGMKADYYIDLVAIYPNFKDLPVNHFFIFENKLFVVADFTQIFIFDNFDNLTPGQAPITLGMPKSVGCSTTAFNNSLMNLDVINNKLILSDTFNNRVLIWNEIPSTNSAAPDVVLGQKDFNSCDIKGISKTGLAKEDLIHPRGLWSDGQKLMVVSSTAEDHKKSFIKIWNNIPTVNGTPPDLVTTAKDVTGSATENYFDLSIENDKLFLTNTVAHKVLGFKIVTSDTSLRFVPFSYVPKEAMNLNSENTVGNGGLKGVSKIIAYNDRLYVLDSTYYRVLIFDIPN